MNASELVLYYAPGSSSMAAHIALHEVGVAFEGRVVSFAKKETRTREFMEVNPEGKVPALFIDGRRLTEVIAILYYLARRFPEAQLLPHGDFEAEAQILSWCSFVASTIHPARKINPERVPLVWRLAEQRLGAREWAVDRYSIADIHLFRLFWRFRRATNPAPEEYPNLEAHHARMMARAAVQRTIEVESAAGYELQW
jgi:glutathione S-transferase